MFLYARTIHGLPGKIFNANTKPRSKGRGFFLPKSVHWTLFIRQDNTLAYPESQVTRTQEPPTKVGGFFLQICPVAVPDICLR